MSRLLSATVLGAATLSAATCARAQVAARPAQPAAVEEVVVEVGSRAAPRLATESAAPVDVISGATLRAQGFTDINRALAFITPSFNFPRGATAPSSANTRAATLRGLAPDQVLVLVNGKRWHSSSVINFNNVFGRGSTPTDLGAIPLSAVDHIEVLRDGAAAQYGSDAIAGVIDIVLRSDLEGLASVQSGTTEAGDGQNTTASLGKGFALGDRGRITVTGEARYRNDTNRAQIDSVYGRVTNQQGDPDSLDLSGAANGQYRLAAGVELYGDLVFDRRKSISPAQYRGPKVSPLIYPTGFIPHIRVDLDDVGATLGLRGQVAGWRWDLGDTPGYNAADFDVRDTANTTLGAAGPRRFDGGGARYLQNVLDLTVSRPFAVLSGANLSFGAEHRYERFKIRAGEPGSFIGAGAQGFPGFNPPTPVDADRTSEAVFAEGELKPMAALSLGAAVRYEHYSDFGDTTSGKLSLFYKPEPFLAVRATASTGFRAPSLQQTFFSTVTSQSTNGVLINVGTFAVGDPVARALGASPLRPETSTSVSAGVVVTPFAGFAFTADAFHIGIDDRVALSETLAGAAVAAVLKGAGITNASSARFFTNAADTATDGYEFTASWRGRIGPEARFEATAGYGAVDTDIRKLRANPVLPALPLLATGSIDLLTKATPRNKATLTTRLEWRAWRFSADLARFGSFRAIQVVSEQTYNPVTTLDLSIDYAFSRRLSLGFGVLNLGDAYPDKIADRALTQGGSIAYPEVGGVGTNGREYFVRAASRF